MITELDSAPGDCAGPFYSGPVAGGILSGEPLINPLGFKGPILTQSFPSCLYSSFAVRHHDSLAQPILFPCAAFQPPKLLENIYQINPSIPYPPIRPSNPNPTPSTTAIPRNRQRRGYFLIFLRIRTFWGLGKRAVRSVSRASPSR